MQFNWTIRKNKLKPSLQNDVLFNLMLVPNTIISNKFLVVINYFFLGFVLLQPVFVFSLVIAKKEWKLLHGQYAAYTCNCAIVWTSYFTMYINVDKYVNLYRDIFPHLWPLDIVGHNHFTKFQKVANVLKWGKNILMVVSFLTATVGLPWFINQYEYIITIRVYKDYVDKWMALFSFILSLSHYHIALTLIACVLGFVYMVVHLYNQCLMLNKRLQALDDEQLFQNMGNKNYQVFINKEMKLCIQQHQVLIKYAQRLNDVMYYPIFFFTLSGIVSGVTILLFPKNNLKNMLIIAFVILLAGVFTISFCYFGQMLENASEKFFFSAYCVTWYLWSTKNRKLLNVFLLKTQENLTLSSSGIVNVNFRLLISLYQSISSCLAFLLNVK